MGGQLSLSLPGIRSVLGPKAHGPLRKAGDGSCPLLMQSKSPALGRASSNVGGERTGLLEVIIHRPGYVYGE